MQSSARSPSYWDVARNGGRCRLDQREAADPTFAVLLPSLNCSPKLREALSHHDQIARVVKPYVDCWIGIGASITRQPARGAAFDVDSEFSSGGA